MVLNLLAKATTTEILKEKAITTFDKNKTIALQEGTIAGDARKTIDAKTGKKVVSELHAKQLKAEKKNVD